MDGHHPRVLRQALRVTAVGGGTVEVNVDRAAGCTGCAARAGCAANALAEIAEGAPLRLCLPSGSRVRPGDEVVVEIPAGGFLGAAAFAYLLPPLVLVGSVALFTALGLPEPVVAVLGLSAFALSFWPVRRAEQRGRLLTDLTIVGIIPHGGPPA